MCQSLYVSVVYLLLCVLDVTTLWHYRNRYNMNNLLIIVSRISTSVSVIGSVLIC